MLSKLLYLHGIYYNVIRQDPNHDMLFNITNILIEKWQKIIPYKVCRFWEVSVPMLYRDNVNKQNFMKNSVYMCVVCAFMLSNIIYRIEESWK